MEEAASKLPTSTYVEVNEIKYVYVKIDIISWIQRMSSTKESWLLF